MREFLHSQYYIVFRFLSSNINEKNMSEFPLIARFSKRDYKRGLSSTEI